MQFVLRIDICLNLKCYCQEGFIEVKPTKTEIMSNLKLKGALA